jgi:putative SOS response-associated peptidase YedK
MEQDHNKDSHWFTLEESQFIQGLVVHYNNEQRIYVVTVEPDPLTKQIHDRWPRIIYNTV